MELIRRPTPILLGIPILGEVGGVHTKWFNILSLITVTMSNDCLEATE